MGSKYIGMDVHQATIVIAVLNETGKCVMETIIETKTSIIVDFIRGLRGMLYVTLEEGTYAAWLHDVLSPHVEKVVVCEQAAAVGTQVGQGGCPQAGRVVAQRPVVAGLSGSPELADLEGTGPQLSMPGRR